MKGWNGGRVRAALIGIVATTALAAAPTVASAAVATGGTGVQTQRESFVRYLNAFGGTITATGGATYAPNTSSAADDTVTYAFDGASTTYNVARSGGTGVIGLSGGVRYQLPAHYIDVSLSDPRITVASATGTATVSAVVSYDPLEPLIQVRNPTTPTRVDVFTLALSGTFVGGATSNAWTNAPAALTADGATAFNGGANGSYRAGSAFGSWSFSARS